MHSPQQAAPAARSKTAAQRAAHNRTGLPDKLKAGVEKLSGRSLDHVRVHRNSAKPAQLNAHAYAQGSDIHLAPGQEKHLPHEAWHIVQQAQGRVRPTAQLQCTPINDDPVLEREADAIGARAATLHSKAVPTVQASSAPIQAKKIFRNGQQVEVPDDYPLKRGEFLVPPPRVRTPAAAWDGAAAVAPQWQPPALPPIERWDTHGGHHTNSDAAAEPLLTRFRSAPPEDSLSRVSVDQAVAHMEAHGRMFSHELPSDYIFHAIAQSGVQSGYNTTAALALPQPRRDAGSAAAKFVFTRQLPSDPRVATPLSEGQVGASANAMLVLRPGIFADRTQPAFFKLFDGAHHTPTIMPHGALRGDHLQHGSDEIAGSVDRHFHANQEQGLLGAMGLEHLASIVLKSAPGQEQQVKAEFVRRLRTTPRAAMLPPAAERQRIKSAQNPAAAHAAFQSSAAGQQSLYDHLHELINRDADDDEERRVEDIILALPHDTPRVSIAEHIRASAAAVPRPMLADLLTGGRMQAGVPGRFSVTAAASSQELAADMSASLSQPAAAAQQESSDEGE